MPSKFVENHTHASDLVPIFILSATPLTAQQLIHHETSPWPLQPSESAASHRRDDHDHGSPTARSPPLCSASVHARTHLHVWNGMRCTATWRPRHPPDRFSYLTRPQIWV
ncbi:hypothetical protein NL676_012570 [Syzygium grande]|nr:hypothetical protein NL676_012570 [Syzygium grande]